MLLFKITTVTFLLCLRLVAGQEEFCNAAPAPNLPTVAECRSLSDDGIEYAVEVTPILGRGYSAQCDVTIVIAGTIGETQPIVIAASDKGIIRKQTVTRQDIGSPSQLRIFLRGTPQKKWKCQRIIIRQSFKWWGFDCTGVLDPDHETAVYPLAGNKMYSITVQTGNEATAGTHGAVEINLKGETGQTGSKLLKQGFFPGSQVVVNFRAADVGRLTDITISNTADDDPWYCTFVDIRAEDGQVAHFNVRRWNGLPYDRSISISLKAQHAMDLPPQDIECFTRASDVISGIPDLLEVTKVQCPVNCDNNQFAFVRGSSVHPSTSSICQSAIMDGVIGSSGGELVLTTLGSLPEYFEPPDQLTKVTGHDYEPSPDKPTFTYFVYQSYSIDNIEKDVRVVDAYGKLAATGRLEVRRNGQWGAVCSKGDLGEFNQEAARKACEILGYIHGIYLDSGCGFVKGTNVCGGKGYHTVVAGVQCTGSEKSFLDCTFEEPPSMCSDHVFDVAVQCTNFPPNREPPSGTIRMVDSSGAPAVLGVGRLEYYLDGWGSICDDGWTPASEGVACREMGYSAVKAGRVSREGCKDVQGVNMCGKMKQKINVINMACDGTEKNVRNCAHETGTDIYCVHDEDIVISCEGNGDPSGMGLYTREDAPEVSVRPYTPLVNLNCGDRPINTKSLAGKPGAMFTVRCPEGCLEDVTDVKGTFIYTDDSSVCRSAIHAGAIDDSGGDFVLVLGYGQRSYAATTRNTVKSLANDAYTRSFMVSKVLPSVRAKVAPESKRKVYDHFAGESMLTKMPGELSFLQDDTSTSSPVVQPIFSWCPPPGWQGFKQRPKDFIDATNLPGGKLLSTSKDFTISVKAQVAGGSGTWRIILAHSECNGFSLAINPEDELVFEQICHPKTLYSGFKPKLDEWFHVVVTFFSPDKTAAIFINSKRLVHEVTDYTFNLRGRMTIGRSSDLESEYFVGDIACVRVFGFVMNPNQIQGEKEIIEKPVEACPRGGGSGGGGKSRYTVDGRLCLTTCLPKESQPSPPVFAVVATRPAFKISCEQTLSLDKFDGSSGAVFRVICPQGCCASTAPVYGLRVYSAASSVCRAALHQGLIGDNGGEISVTLQNGMSFYDGAIGENLVESKAQDTPQSRSFSISEAQPVRSLSCHDDALFIMKSAVTKHEVVNCPENCGDLIEASVFGTGLYSPSSSVCRAAIHAGVLTDLGGQVELKIESESKFEGSEQNGVTSKPADFYLRSFSFPRTSEAACFPFSLASSTTDTSRTPRSYWIEYSPETATSGQSSFIVKSDKQGILSASINDFKCSNLPKLLVLRDFRCNKFTLKTTMILTNSTTSAGLAFGVQDDHTFFRLEAVVERKDGTGKWKIEKILQDEKILAGPQVPDKFTFNIPINLLVTSDGEAIKAWITMKNGENRMIANVKDITTSKKLGSVGFSVCEAPTSGVTFTSFEVSPTPATLPKTTKPESFRHVKNREFTAVEQRPLAETISGWKVITSLL